MNSLDLNTINHALIVGAGHGIGLSLVKELLRRNSHVQIFATYRNSSKAEELIRMTQEFSRLTCINIDPLRTDHLELLQKKIKLKTSKVDLIINSVGFLHDANTKPEKSLMDINITNLTKVFEINAAITPLIAKYFHSFLQKDTLSAFVSISAKVGSIEDNRMGGWYAYRASKAALNMFIKNIAHEFGRKNKKTIVSSIHPGTTMTELSAPYTEKTNLILHTPRDTAINILNVIENQKISDSGKFLSWDGSEIPW